MADGGYIAMDQEGLIDLGQFDLSQFGPTSANGGGYFTDPSLPQVYGPAAVDAPGNLAAAFGAVQGMQQAIPDPGPSYEAARAQRMAALMEDLGVLDQGVAAAQQQVATQRARPLNFGNLPIGAEANALFGRAYDFAEGAIGQGRISAEAKLRAQANQALDQILSGNYQAGYQGQVQQALDLPNQALTAAGQFNSVGQSNQQTELQTLLENSANRRAEMAAQQAQQQSRFGEAGTDARFRMGLANSNAQLGVQQSGEDRRQYYNAVYTDLLANNSYFRQLPLEQQKLAIQMLTNNQSAALESDRNNITREGNYLSAQTSTANQNSSIAASVFLENQRSQNDASLARLQAELNATDPNNVAQRSLIESQITENRAQAASIQAKADQYAKYGLTTTAQQNQFEKDASQIETVKTAAARWSPIDTSEDGIITQLAAAAVLEGTPMDSKLPALAKQVAESQYPPRLTLQRDSKTGKTYYVPTAMVGTGDAKKKENWVNFDPDAKVRQEAEKAALARLQALYDQRSGKGFGLAGKRALAAEYTARSQTPEFQQALAATQVQGAAGAAKTGFGTIAALLKK